MQSDDEGNAIRMFIGKADEDGVIKGDRYSRTLKKGREGKIIKITGKEREELPEF